MKRMRADDMNRAIRLADDLMDELRDGTDNVAEMLAGIAIAIRRLQGYNDYLLLSFDPTLRDIPTHAGEE